MLAMLLGFVILSQSIANYLLIKVLRGNNRNMERQKNVSNARESELIDRIMHMNGVTWTAPPRTEKPEEDIDENTKLALAGWQEA